MGNEEKFDCARLRSMDMVDYLATIGIQPQRVRGNDFWYLSPLRTEKTASFKINRKLNRWYDFGEGAGGNLIDFALRYHNCTMADLLRMAGTDISFLRPHRPLPPSGPAPAAGVQLLATMPLNAPALRHYVRERRIPPELAGSYCRQVNFTMNNKTLYGIGFANDAGGYEIRTTLLKCSTSPKATSTIAREADTVYVFEGFFDFLSFLVILPDCPADFLILNSLSLFDRARPFLERHAYIGLLLDNDTAGRNFTSYALSLSPAYHDDSHLYAGYKDLNEWLCFFGSGTPSAGTSP